MTRTKGKKKGLIWLNAEIKALEAKNDPASRERIDELVDELITLDMAMGPIRRAMGRPTKKGKIMTPEEKEAVYADAEEVISKRGALIPELLAKIDEIIEGDYSQAADIGAATDDRGPGNGLADLMNTLRKAQLPFPPVPESLRSEIVRRESWVWSTRPIDPMAMYLFRDYLVEAVAGPVDNYFAICHAGHGVNSYGLNYHLVYGPLALFIQNGWGGVYSKPEYDKARIFVAFRLAAQLIAQIEMHWPGGQQIPCDGLIVAYSDFRDISMCRLRSEQNLKLDPETLYRGHKDQAGPGSLLAEASAKLKKLATRKNVSPN